MGYRIGYARVSTADQDPQRQLDALAEAGCDKVYVDVATGTKADRPEWMTCLADLRPGDKLVFGMFALMAEYEAAGANRR